MAKRNAVVVTHTRLRQTGTVVAEAVSQLRVAGFEVAIIDNTEAPDFGVQPRNHRTRAVRSAMACRMTVQQYQLRSLRTHGQ